MESCLRIGYCTAYAPWTCFPECSTTDWNDRLACSEPAEPVNLAVETHGGSRFVASSARDGSRAICTERVDRASGTAVRGTSPGRRSLHPKQLHPAAQGAGWES